jgi:hypothetical protein
VKTTRLVALMAAALLAAPRAALACPVCFGESNSPMALAMNSGILFMLGIVGAMLACMAAFIVYLVRRARLAEAIDAARNPQEGTAQC